MHGHSGTLAANDITITRGAATILAGVTVGVTHGARIGLVGPNGAGKSTLLRALAGLDRPDRGTVVRRPATLSVGYLPQERDLAPGETLHAYLARRTGVAQAEVELHAATEPYDERAYASALERFLALGGGDLDVRAAQVCAELGLPVGLDRPVGTLSGGESARAALASILLARFDVFLLDEPTNDLDFAGLDRLERFVAGLRGGAVIVSHDREFLDRTVDRVLELDPNTLQATAYAGGWSEYAAAREQARAEHERAYAEWSQERQRFADLRSQRRTEARAGGAKADRRGTHALMSKVRSAERRLERLDRDRVDKPWEPWRLRLELAPAARAGEDVASLERAVVERGDFRLGPVDLHVRWGERVAIVGRNGSGKSTLLAALLGRVPLTCGTRRLGPGVVAGEIEQHRGLLDTDQTLLDAFLDESGLRSDDARTLLAKFDLYADHVLRPARTLSPGERTRAILALQSARGANLLVLDEPTNHLDLPAIEELERALGAYTGTLVLVSHDRRFLAAVGVTRTVALS